MPLIFPQWSSSSKRLNLRHRLCDIDKPNFQLRFSYRLTFLLPFRPFSVHFLWNVMFWSQNVIFINKYICMYMYVNRELMTQVCKGDIRVSNFPSEEEKAKHSHCFLLFLKNVSIVINL